MVSEPGCSDGVASNRVHLAFARRRTGIRVIFACEEHPSEGNSVFKTEAKRAKKDAMLAFRITNRRR